jgi:hypothetical protein
MWWCMLYSQHSRRWRAQGQPGLHSETLSQKNEKQTNKNVQNRIIRDQPNRIMINNTSKAIKIKHMVSTLYMLDFNIIQRQRIRWELGL